MTFSRPRVAVTGIGMVTGLGLGTETTLARLMRGESAISSLSGVYHRSASAPLAAEVPWRPSEPEPRHEPEQSGNRSCVAASERYAELAAREALDCAGLSGIPVELVLGASTGATREGVAECASRDDQSVLPLIARLVLQPIGTSGHRLSDLLGAVRSSTVLCSACSSGALAIAVGAMRLEQGSTLPQLVGGTDSLNLLTLSGFEALGASSVVPCRPFDVEHCGLNLGEGAGFLVLETEEMVARRNGSVLVWLDGYAVGAEAHHLTHPEVDGGRAAALILEAIRRAGVAREAVGYVNAHGTATIANDEMETRALRRAFGDSIERLYVSSCKGQIGHTLAAAGAIEAAITARAIIEQAVPPTGGLVQPADECRLRHVMGAAVASELRVAISNSFGFGGACAVLALQHRDAEQKRGSVLCEPIYVTGLITLGPSGILRGRDIARWLDSECGNQRIDLPFEPLDLLVMERSRRFDRLTALTTLGCTSLLSDGLVPGNAGPSELPEPVGLVLGNALGPVGRSAEFVQRILKRGAKGANPAEFPHLLPSAVSGNASIYAGLRGPVFNVSDTGSTIQAALELGITCLRARMAAAMLVGTTECRDAAVVVAQQQDPLLGAIPADANDGSAWLLLEGQSGAEARGAQGCELVEAVWLGGATAPTGAMPSPACDSIVLTALAESGDGSGETTAVLESLGWAGVATRSCMPRAFDGWSHPGFVLAAGAALVTLGQCTSAMVLTPSRRGTHCAVFRRGRNQRAESGAS